MGDVECYLADELTDADTQACTRLDLIVWPPEVRAGRTAQLRSADPPPAGTDEQRARVWLIRDSTGDIIAKAAIAPREIATQRGRLVVAALKGVCVHPDQRGHGYGRRVVKAAFEAVDDRRFEVAFFQTGVPAFYEAFGARCVDNPLTNSLAEDPGLWPLWDEAAMIYPGSYDWPEGVVDLQGPAW